ncbi:MAG: VWA domain-containing protein [Treponema sp.]|nr:VWA domain-containing protein [Treponema sp.]
MMEFENPGAFFLLLLIPLFFFLRYVRIFSPITFPLTLGDWHGKFFNWNSRLRQIASTLSTVLAVSCFVSLIIAYSNPVIHHQEKIYSSRGADILFVLDTSPSMAAKDMSDMKRIDAAKQAIKALQSESTGDSVGLVEMAKEAAVVVPPTMDRNVFFSKLDDIVLGEMGDGTAIGNGLACAIMHLESSRSPRKSIVLITDGENNAGTIHPHTAAHLAHDKNISLYVLGIGTKGTVPLEYMDPMTGKIYSGFLNSNYDSTVLAQIAAEGGGKFFEAESLSALSQTLDSVERSESLVQTYHIKNMDEEFYRLFIALGAAFLVFAVFIRRFALKEVL